jgi:hypothetical protein
MHDFFVHNTMVNRLNSHRNQQDRRELLRVRRVLLERHGAVEDAGGCDDHGHVVGCEGGESVGRSWTWFRDLRFEVIGQRTHLSMILQQRMKQSRTQSYQRQAVIQNFRIGR